MTITTREQVLAAVRRVVNLARALAGYGVFLLCLMSAASSLAIWLAKWGSA